MIKISILLFLLSFQAIADVQVCGRVAQIMGGMVDHKWIETDSVSAGMGSNNPNIEQIGDTFEAPFITDVYVVDHSDQQEEYCQKLKHVDEDCVNRELTIGRYLGTFNPLNHCQAFVAEVIETCESEARKEARSWITTELAKARGPRETIPLNRRKKNKIQRLKREYGL